MKFIDIYKDTKDLATLMDNHDLEGRNCWWYFLRYELHEILDVKVMDKFISSKWNN